MPHVLQNKQSWMPTDGAFCHTRPAFHVISRDWQDVNEKYERRVFSNPLSIFVRLLCFWHGVHAAIKKLAAVGDFPLAVAHVSLFSTPVCSWRCIWRVETVLCLCISHWQLNCHPILFHAMLSSAISSHVPLIFGPGHTAICSVKKTGTLWFGIAPALYPAQVLLSEIMMRVGKVLQIIYSTSLNPKTSSARFCRNCCRILWCPKQTKKLRINLHETCYETRPRLSGTIKPLSSQLTPAAKTWHDSFEKLLKRDFRSEKKMRLESPGVVCTLIFTWFARVRHDSEDLQILNSLNSRFDPARSVLQAGEKRNRSSKNWHIWHMNLSLIHHHTWQWRLTIEAGVTSTKKTPESLPCISSDARQFVLPTPHNDQNRNPTMLMPRMTTNRVIYVGTSACCTKSPSWKRQKPKPPGHDHGIWGKILINKTVGNVAVILFSVTRSDLAGFDQFSLSQDQCSDHEQQEALQVWTDYDSKIFVLPTTRGFWSQPMLNTWILLNLPMWINRGQRINLQPSSALLPLLVPGIIEHSTDVQQSSWAKHAKWTVLLSLAFKLSISKKDQEISGYQTYDIISISTQSYQKFATQKLHPRLSHASTRASTERKLWPSQHASH